MSLAQIEGEQIMVIPRRQLARVLILSAVLVSCGDQPPPAEPAIPHRGTTSTQRAAPVETTLVPVADAEALQLSPGASMAMARTLTAALVEFDLQPNVSLNALQDFLQQVEAQQAARRQTRHDLLRTVHP